MENPEFKRRVGQKVKSFIDSQQPKLKYCEVLEGMGYKRRDSRLSKLMSGDHIPEGPFMAELARYFGLHDDYFLEVSDNNHEPEPAPETDSEQLDRLFLERLVAMLDQVMALGKSFPTAWDQVTGKPALPSEAERARLAEVTPAFREYLQLLTGRAWDLLTEDEKREVALDLLKLKRGEAVTPRDREPR